MSDELHNGVYRQEDVENEVVERLADIIVNRHVENNNGDDDNDIKNDTDSIRLISHDDVKAVIDVMWDVIYDALVRGNTVKLHGKGQFYLSKRSARIGRNPHTGEEHHIPEREIMAFRVSAAVAKRLRAEREKVNS